MGGPTSRTRPAPSPRSCPTSSRAPFTRRDPKENARSGLVLNRLTYSVTFPSTGKSLSGDFSFQEGFGAITGPNEAGKSVILEMIRYCLFGTRALRGKSDDYKNLKADLTFTAKGETYLVKRTITTARIFRDETEIANGQKGVNTKVAEILGFGLDVFDTACVANQGDIEKLGSMLPSERKQMVDSVIGMSAIDDIAKWCGQEANSLASLISGMEEGLVKPVKPTPPPEYVPSKDLAELRDAQRVLNDELNQIKGRLSQTRMSKPDKPVAPVSTTAAELEILVDKARAYEQAQAELKRIPPPPPPFSEDGIDDWELRQKLARNYALTMTAEQVAKADADAELVRKFERLDHLQKQLRDLLDVGTHTCPACSHEWPMEADRVTKVQIQVETLKVELKDLERPGKPDMVNVDVARRQLQAFEKIKDDWERVKDAVEPPHTRQQVAEFKVALAAQARRAELEAVEPATSPSKELNALWRDRLAYESDLASYEARLADWEAQESAYAKDQARADELAEVPSNLRLLEAHYEQAKIYEDRLASYKRDQKVYAERQTEIKARKEREAGFRKGRDAMTILRRLVKQHLIPSLNKVASHYVSKMTGGQRNVIEVDEDFEIKVDNQPINTLSGSGKAVANLALRLGLGQVLTNNVFSVFLGDEIDASMDADRAHNTALTLEYLASRISQILLVSHKYPQADYYIELEANEANSN
ncbi:SMC family ATPase [Mesorhizobium sp. M2E.F.Ca.ET.166.01.1.1]|nr:SMC family ATPase [Mesorhizobium sp. M2E.F.Ca.ET.166.01.1.1]TGV97001.1 SMC family ATPase [Mesorhizobium sp. M2E.F.Ca.ET.154.01.1.1]